MFILDCVVNFYDSVEVPERVLREPAFFRLRAKGREPRLKRELSRSAADGSLDEALTDLFNRWDRDKLEEMAHETQGEFVPATASDAEEVDVP